MTLLWANSRAGLEKRLYLSLVGKGDSFYFSRWEKGQIPKPLTMIVAQPTRGNYFCLTAYEAPMMIFRNLPIFLRPCRTLSP